METWHKKMSSFQFVADSMWSIKWNSSLIEDETNLEQITK